MKCSLIKVSWFNNFISFPADVPLGNVKLGELSAWVGRRNMSVNGVAGGISRGKFW